MIHLKKRLFTPVKTQLDYNTTIQDNEYQINALSGYLALLSLGCALITLFLDLIGVFILDTGKSVFVAAIMAPFAILSFIVGTVLNTHRPWVKYFLTVNECILVFILYTFLSMHAVLWFVIPLVKSSLYFNRKLTKLCFWLSSLVMLAGHITSVPLSITPNDTIIISYYDSLVYGFVPRYLEFLIFAIVTVILTNNSSTLIEHTYEMAEKNNQLLNDLKSTNYEITKNLATISENKSKDTGEHITRVYEYMKVLAQAFGYDPDDIYDICLSAMLHDIGKLAVDEKILSKPAKLTPEEFSEVKKHVTFGKELLANSTDPVMRMAAVIAEQHHERWDGKGYLGMHGDEIDQLSRMMSVVDVFDALTSRRCYKEPWSVEAAYEEIVNGSGTQFDPAVVDKFKENFDKFKDICRRLNPDCAA